MLPLLQHIAPQRTLTAIAHTLANCKIPYIKNHLIRYFVNKYPIRLEDALEENPYHYTSFNDFFTRSLKPTVRPITTLPNTIASPVDGQISQIGTIQQGHLIQAKGFSYTVHDLLGGDVTLASPFLQGHFLTAYLAPKDYHRVHMPVEGSLTHMIYIPGRLFSVNPKTASTVSRLFARNERVVTLFNTPQGRMAVILVGAMIVGSIETVWAGTVTPSYHNAHAIQTWHYETPITLCKGQEMGLFKLGSTVIVLFEDNTIAWDNTLASTQDIQMGQSIGNLLTGKHPCTSL